MKVKARVSFELSVPVEWDTRSQVHHKLKQEAVDQAVLKIVQGKDPLKYSVDHGYIVTMEEVKDA